MPPSSSSCSVGSFDLQTLATLQGLGESTRHSRSRDCTAFFLRLGHCARLGQCGWYKSFTRKEIMSSGALNVFSIRLNSIKLTSLIFSFLIFSSFLSSFHVWKLVEPIRLNLPISPLCDRTDFRLGKSQAGRQIFRSLAPCEAGFLQFVCHGLCRGPFRVFFRSSNLRRDHESRRDAL